MITEVVVVGHSWPITVAVLEVVVIAAAALQERHPVMPPAGREVPCAVAVAAQGSIAVEYSVVVVPTRIVVPVVAD